MNVEMYSRKIKVHTEKMVKKMFGFNSVKEAIDCKIELAKELESVTNKPADKILISDAKKIPNGCYKLAKYTTLKELTDIYINSVVLRFMVKEMEVYENEN